MTYSISQQNIGAMDPRKLLYFAAIVENGSLAKAARALDISQPALTKLGIKLLDRSPTGITATTSGELIYAHAKLIRTEMELAGNRLRGKSDDDSRVITFGTLPSLASHVVPLAVAKWKEEYPRVLLRVVEKKQVELLLELLRGEFDFIVGQTEFFDVSVDGLKQRVLFRDRLCILAQPTHQLFHKEILSWGDLAKYPWVCPMIAWPQRAMIESLVSEEGFEPPQQLVECGSIEFIKSLVASSDHLAMLPIHSVSSAIEEGKIKVLSFSVPAFKRNIAVIFRQNSPLDASSLKLVSHIEKIGNDLSFLSP
jgi:LysR family transcriptional regulator of gallate degradation